MSDLLGFRRHRFDALHALLVGDIRKKSPDHFAESNHLRRDVGLPETAARPTSFYLVTPMFGFRR